MFAPTMKQETVQFSDGKETNSDNYMSLKSPNCVNYYDDQFSVSTEVKDEFPEDEYPQSSTGASCINNSAIDSNIVYENDQLSKVLEIKEIKQEVSEETFSFIKTGEVHDKKDKFITRTEMSKEYRILGNARDTSLLYKVLTTPQEIQPKMSGGVLKNRFNSSTHNNEHKNIVPPTLVGNEGNELQKCPCCVEYFKQDDMLAHVDSVHNHKSELYHENTKKNQSGKNVHDIKYKCDSCKRIYKSKSALVLHFKKVHYSYGKLFECWCGEQFVTPRHLRQHKSRQHSTKVKSTNNSALEEEFKCDICKKKFKNEDTLKIHVTSSHYDYGKTFKCWCGKQFRTPIHLYRHKAK